MKEIQLTSGAYGHTLNATQVFSPDDQWIVFDARNDDTHISRTGRIEMVNVATGEVVELYATKNQTIYGPGVGAAAWNPIENKVIFIHGLLNCNEEHPYGFTRRFGAIVEVNNPSVFIHAEARCIQQPLVPGALRGGTHAHTWSGDGKWISFTYNDFLIESVGKSSQSPVKDLRTIGVMAPLRKVSVPVENEENFSGEYFAVLAATVIMEPSPGSDEIERAFDECWIGNDGYIKRDGTRQKRAIAFQGNVRDAKGALLTEVFIADIPDDIIQAMPGKPLEGTLTSRPNVPDQAHQRRITYTGNRKYPGLQGLRFRLRSSPDGAYIYFLMKDDSGITQIFEVSVYGGEIRQITHLDQSVQTQFNVSPDGKTLAYAADNAIWTSDIKSGISTQLTKRAPDEEAPANGVLWSYNGEMLVYNRYAGEGKNRYLQIFTIAF